MTYEQKRVVDGFVKAAFGKDKEWVVDVIPRDKKAKTPADANYYRMCKLIVLHDKKRYAESDQVVDVVASSHTDLGRLLATTKEI